MKRRIFRSAVALLLPLALPLAIFAGAGGSPQAGAADQQGGGQGQAPPAPLGIMEGYPNRIQARLEQRNRSLRAFHPPANGLSPRFILNLSKRWNSGQTVKVAFKGGSASLQKQIADNVTEWTRYANLSFDFGSDGAGGFRRWSPSDTSYTADIRVSFDQSGYYSLVGNDSTNSQVTRPGEESLNLEGFDRQLPSDWKAVSLHEFGHAIGFEHEHQSPIAPCDFRFDDDPGYVPTTDSFGQFIQDSRGRRPGLYTQLGGPPNNWPQAVVDFNLKSLPESHAYEVGPFDKDSIMKYFFDSSMFVSGTSSACYTSSENLVLSDGDKAGAAKVYPRDASAIATSAKQRARAIQSLNETSTLPAAARDHFRRSLDSIQDR
jgi:hypothetical protein